MGSPNSASKDTKTARQISRQNAIYRRQTLIQSNLIGFPSTTNRTGSRVTLGERDDERGDPARLLPFLPLFLLPFFFLSSSSLLYFLSPLGMAVGKGIATVPVCYSARGGTVAGVRVWSPPPS